MKLIGQQSLDQWFGQPVGIVFVNQQGFCSATYSGAAQFGIEDDIDGHVEICGFVDIDMNQTFQVGKDRYTGIALHPLNQPLAASWDNYIDIAVQAFQHFSHCSAVSYWHKLDSVFGKAGGFQSGNHAVMDGAGGIETVRTAPQNDRVARLQTERTGICSDIGTASGVGLPKPVVSVSIRGNVLPFLDRDTEMQFRLRATWPDGSIFAINDD